MKKKNLLFLAVGGAFFALTSCSSDETIANNQSVEEANTISFRPLMNNVTRAADITVSNLSSFKAYAKKHTGSAVYFNEDAFSKQDDGSYTSTNKHYWPATDALDFFAYAPATDAQITGHTAQSLTFTVTPADVAGSQVDLIVANTDDKTKLGTYGVGDASQYGRDGIPLNFRHTGSKIVVKFKNTQANLKIGVQAFKIVNVDGSATFTFSDSGSDVNTDTHNAQLAGGWTDNSDYNKTYTYTPTAVNTISASQTTELYLQDGGTASADVNAASEMILIPQTTTTSDAYSGTTENAAFTANKTYIAVKMIIRNNDGDPGTVIADATANNKWAIWPVAFTWLPGKKYTYVIDLGDGGYWETNTDDGNADLDPILENAVIKFVSVNVDDWSEYDYAPSTDGNQPIPVPVPAP